VTVELMADAAHRTHQSSKQKIEKQYAKSRRVDNYIQL
jgi:hypothetical protein